MVNGLQFQILYDLYIYSDSAKFRDHFELSARKKNRWLVVFSGKPKRLPIPIGIDLGKIDDVRQSHTRPLIFHHAVADPTILNQLIGKVKVEKNNIKIIN